MIRKSMMNFRAIIAVALLVQSINCTICALIFMNLKNLIIPIGNAFASFLNVREQRVWKHTVKGLKTILWAL
nr:MAG TPA: hypothetical protein [Caudoviricetes sp.]